MDTRLVDDVRNTDVTPQQPSKGFPYSCADPRSVYTLRESCTWRAIPVCEFMGDMAPTPDAATVVNIAEFMSPQASGCVHRDEAQCTIERWRLSRGSTSR